MAQKRTSKKAKKKRMAMASDTQLAVALRANDATGIGQGVIDVVEEMCKVNHRLYRQGMTYPVQIDAHPAGSISSVMQYKLYTLANNWFVHGAIKYAFRNWRASLQEELMGGAVQGRFLDWRIAHTNPDGDNTKLIGATWDGDGYNDLEAGEYNFTTTTGADGSEDSFNLFGALSAHFNIFNEYAKYLDTRKPDDQAITVASSYNGLHEGDDLLTREGLVEDFDNPPYPNDLAGTNWADAVMVLADVVTVDNNSHYGRSTSRVIDAPLGFVFVVKDVDGSATDIDQNYPELTLRVKSGSYKGTAAKPIVRWPGDLRLASAKSNR